MVMSGFREFLNKLVNLLFPPRCAGCYELLPFNSKEALCDECRKKWEAHKNENCSRCGQPIPFCWCNVPNNKEGSVDSEYHLVQYRSDVESMVYTMIHFMKRNYSESVFSFVSNELCDRVVNDDDFQECVVTSVPRSNSSVKRIGHDQSYEIAKRFCVVTGIKYADVLYHKGNVKQKKLNIKKRIKNAKKSYFIKNGSAELVKNKTVYLIDDVVTTGSTVVRCAQLLKTKGAKKVIVLSVAKTVR